MENLNNMSTNLKITVITATYNSVNTLEQTISSVINQTYKNIEYIIIDGGSTDGTVDIIKKYEKHIACWISEPDKGIYDAFNKGVSLSTGDYVEFVGSDDCFVSSNIIQEVVNSIDPDTDILSATEYLVNEEWKRQLLYSNKIAIDKNSFAGGMIPHGAMFAKRELLEKWPFDVSYKIAADMKFFLKCYMDDSIVFKFIELPVLFFAQNGISASMVDVTQQEVDRVYNELGLPYRMINLIEANDSAVKRMTKKALQNLGVFDSVKTFRDKYFVWKKHSCSNIVCRWCGRV